ncbi:hypothetical protein KBY85_13570 [Cyanobium sp. BA5m-10]|uniref:hypothetical protein n=1 Tax=Cyanobium sp. BA5m-10 TaxID=2823705 RepID=UPI0020CDFC9E|nr:hypothetical protein [Cyanobium sp. BA5m-10]MCP9905156.1 hypothetical protein [Cyanobium sp. BA5m-10]
MKLFDSPAIAIGQKLSKYIKNFAVYGVFAIGASAQSQEMCYYPVTKESFEFAIVDVTGINDPDLRALLKDKEPAINCLAVPGEAPTCTTPWNGKVYIEQCERNRICIQGMQDREGRQIDFRNQYGNGMLQFEYFNNKERAIGTYRCGQLEGLGVVIGQWYATTPELVGNRFERLTYKIDGQSRIYNAKRQWKIVYGLPVSATSGSKGSF